MHASKIQSFYDLGVTSIETNCFINTTEICEFNRKKIFFQLNKGQRIKRLI